MQTKVYLMMSGGVDSSVAAYLLSSNPNYDVVGVFMKCWSMELLLAQGYSQDLYACNWEEDLIDARMVAEKLAIPFEVWDFQEEYSTKVIGYMIDEYSHGRTPNPDVMCNSVVKFGVFYDKAMSLGADYVATGHYAKIVNIDGQAMIAMANDSHKDQSYFLWNIPADRLGHTLFPIGVIDNKQEVRQIACRQGLMTATKKDSQGLCFVGKSSLREMLTQKLGFKSGHIITNDINNAQHATKLTPTLRQQLTDTGYITIGQHQGAYLYTIGQRDCLNLSGGPWYVQNVDIDNNQLMVVHGSHLEDISSNWVIIAGVNLFSLIDYNQEYSCITRYNQEPISCKIKILDDNQYQVTFNQPVSAIAIGQSLVMYDKGVLVLGAIMVGKSAELFPETTIANHI
jgi:tRNA-uridine 2-sulfurtransferase